MLPCLSNMRSFNGWGPFPGGNAQESGQITSVCPHINRRLDS